MAWMIVSSCGRDSSFCMLTTGITRPETRMERIERPFVRLLSLVAHHPDFAMKEDAPAEHEDWIHAATYV